MIAALDEMRVDSKIMYINVSKRVNTRIFTRDTKGIFKNPSPGTVIDAGLTNGAYEFYLVSTAA
jgi:hypothetical protein